MSLKNIPPQEKILYSRRWNKPIDQVFIKTLLEQNRQGNWGGRTELNFHVVATSIGSVNETFTLNLSYEDVVARRNFLEECYNTYDDITGTPRVWWDQYINKIYVDDGTWQYMMRHNKLVRAYYYRGEPFFESLRMLFRRVQPFPIPVPVPEVINISDDTKSRGNVVGHDVGSTVVLSDSSEKVASPLPSSYNATARRLFDELHSSPRGQQMFPPRPRQRPPLPGTAPSPSQVASPASQASRASQASSSPIRWFWFSSDGSNGPTL